MSKNTNLSSPFYRELVFWVGIIGIIAYRLIIVFNKLPDRRLSDIAWYIGTIGLVWYFGHRYRVEKERVVKIQKSNLVAKVEKSDFFSRQDKGIMLYTLRSLTSSKARLNYIIIFLSSTLALLWDIFDRLINWPIF